MFQPTPCLSVSAANISQMSHSPRSHFFLLEPRDSFDVETPSFLQEKTKKEPVLLPFRREKTCPSQRPGSCCLEQALHDGAHMSQTRSVTQPPVTCCQQFAEPDSTALFVEMHETTSHSPIVRMAGVGLAKRTVTASCKSPSSTALTVPGFWNLFAAAQKNLAIYIGFYSFHCFSGILLLPWRLGPSSLGKVAFAMLGCFLSLFLALTILLETINILSE